MKVASLDAQQSQTGGIYDQVVNLQYRRHSVKEYVPDHFQNLTDSSVIHNLPSPQNWWKSTHIFKVLLPTDK